MTQAIAAVHTPCKNCVFAVYDDITQIDCALKYIDTYKAKNIEIVEAYDDDKEFYVINNKKCIGYREPNWFKHLHMENSTLQEKIDKYNELNSIGYCLILDTQTFDLDNFDAAIAKISSLCVKPQKLIIIRYALNPSKNLNYSNIEQIFAKYKIDFAWKVQTILDENLQAEDILYQTVTQNTQYRFMLYCNDCAADLNILVKTANDIVYKQLDQFNILSVENKHALMFSAGVYKYSIFHGTNILEDTSNYTFI